MKYRLVIYNKCMDSFFSFYISNIAKLKQKVTRNPLQVNRQDKQFLCCCFWDVLSVSGTPFMCTWYCVYVWPCFVFIVTGKPWMELINYPHSLILERHSYRFWTTWGWSNDDSVFIFRWTDPLNLNNNVIIMNRTNEGGELEDEIKIFKELFRASRTSNTQLINSNRIHFTSS